jgi:acyl-CoA synthetase (NDP forming)
LTDHAGARSFFKSPLPVINPPTVAIVGASERARWPTDIFNNLGKGGFPGKIYPVNPRATEVWGQRAYPDLASLPEAPSHALIIVPAPAVLDVLEKGVAAGLKSATIYSGNLGEGLEPESMARGQAIRDLVARSGLIVNGPNCMGGNSLHHRF